jgi:hypothetical protein
MRYNTGMKDKRYWFRRRRMGFGWSPKTWEGWAATAGFVLIQAAVPKIIERRGGADTPTTRKIRFGMAAAFTALVIATGEPLW